MPTLETISTAGLSVRSKLDFWNHAVSTTVTNVVADPVDAVAFNGCLKRIDLGALRIAEICGGASTVRRCATHWSDEPYIFQMPMSGDLLCFCDGVEQALEPGDFWLYPVSSTCRLILKRQTTLLNLRIPGTQLRRHIANPELVRSVVVRGSAAAGSLVSSYLRQFWTGTKNGMLVDLAPRFAQIALEMIASAYAGVAQLRVAESCLVTRRKAQIVAFIEHNLCDPQLTPTSVAGAHRITAAYLHRIFSNGGESVGRYILRRRLEECHRALSDRMQSSRSITEVALRHGFNNVAHFCRAFRQCYGMTPRELRNTSV